jgi:hypothetical protein
MTELRLSRGTPRASHGAGSEQAADRGSCSPRGAHQSHPPCLPASLRLRLPAGLTAASATRQLDGVLFRGFVCFEFADLTKSGGCLSRGLTRYKKEKNKTPRGNHELLTPQNHQWSVKNDVVDMGLPPTVCCAGVPWGLHAQGNTHSHLLRGCALGGARPRQYSFVPPLVFPGCAHADELRPQLFAVVPISGRKGASALGFIGSVGIDGGQNNADVLFGSHDDHDMCARTHACTHALTHAQPRYHHRAGLRPWLCGSCLARASDRSLAPTRHQVRRVGARLVRPRQWGGSRRAVQSSPREAAVHPPVKDHTSCVRGVITVHDARERC